MKTTKNYFLNTWTNILICSFCFTLVINLRGYSQIDFGDAPQDFSCVDNSLGNAYPVTLARNGARHTVVNGIFIGAAVDGEADGNPSPCTGTPANPPSTNADDNDGIDDEDGVLFPLLGDKPALQVGTFNATTIKASQNGFVSLWIDLNQDGDWNDSGEQFYNDQPVIPGDNQLNLLMPDTSVHGKTYVRVRYCTAASACNRLTGLASDGEVEDHEVFVVAAEPSACRGGIINGSFEDLSETNITFIDESEFPGWSFYPPSASAASTFENRNQIEMWGASNPYSVLPFDGDQFVEINANLSGTLYQDVVTRPGTVLEWKFSHRGRVEASKMSLLFGPPGTEVNIEDVRSKAGSWKEYSGSYTVPPGQYITRFAFQDNSGYNNTLGNFIDRVSFLVNEPCRVDYGDAPDSYGTLLSNNGAGHDIRSELFLGSTIDDENDGQPTPAANSDDQNDQDDEDSAVFPTITVIETSYSVGVTVNNRLLINARLHGWVDFNGNGKFDTTEYASVNVNPGILNEKLTLTWSNLECIKAGTTYARIRLSSSSGLNASTPGGVFPDGEVEDYTLEITSCTLNDINCPGPSNMTAGANCSVIVPDMTAGINVSDSCGGAAEGVTVTQTPAAGTTLTGPVTRNIQVTATDSCGNAAECTVALTVNCKNMSFDTVPPDANLGCNPSITPATPGDVTVVNSCSTPTITVAEDSGAVGCTVKLTNTWTAQDTCGASISASQVLTYTNDSQAPVFTSVPADADLGFNPTITPATPGDVTVTDNCGIPSVTVSSSSTKNGDVTTLVNTWTARDACGNEQVATQTLTYRESGAQPQFTTVPPDRTGCNLSITPATIGDVTVVNGCGNKTITLSTTQSTNGCVVTTRNTWTARDECNNTVSAEQEIINTIDTQGPVFSSVPTDVNLGCNPNYTPASEGDVQVTENCTLASLNVTTAGSTNGCTITLINTWTAIDVCGNRATASQEVVYTNDTTAPVFVSAPVSANLGCNPVITPATPNDVTVTDNCGSSGVTLTSSSSQNGCVVTLVNTWTATDSCGNSSSKSQTLTYTADTTDPAMSCPQDQTIDLGSNCKLQLPSFIPGDLADNCTDRASLNVSQFPPSGTWVDAPIDVNVRLSARDACGNQSECLFKISYICALDLGDRVWNDCNNNGVMDAGETGLVNVVVNLLDENGNLQENALTDMNGNYLFDEIPVATYIVEIARNNFHGGVLSDWYNSTGNTSGEEGKDNGLEEKIDLYTNPPANPQNAPGIRSAPVNVSASDILTVDFGFYKEGTIGDFVWEDLNYNGIQDPGEPGLGNVSIQLHNTDSGEIKRQTSDAFGNYEFTGLLCANYYLEFSPPAAEYMASHQDRGEDVADSDMNNAAITINTPLSSGENDRSWDAGFFRYATLEGIVWIDLNKNQDPSDEMSNSLGLNSNTLNISLVGGGAVQIDTIATYMDGNNLQTFANTITTNNGNYQFLKLLPGKYLVTLETNNLPDWLRDSSTHKEYANGVIPTMQKELQSGQQLLDVNFGFFAQTTAISLQRFTAMLYEGGVMLKWETGSEKDNLGFNLYRSVSETSERIPVNAELIPSLNVSSGGRYEWLDEQVGEGTWYYWLEDRDYNGKQTLHGPRIVGVGGERGATKVIKLPKKGGLYRIKNEELTKSGLNDYDRIMVKVNGVEVPLYVNKNRFILFFAPKDSEEIEISLEDFPLRMDSLKMY